MGWVVSVTPRLLFTPGWVGLKAGLETEAREKSFSSVGDLTPVVQSVVRHYTDWAIPAPHTFINPLKLKLVKWHLRIKSAPQIKHNPSPLQTSILTLLKGIIPVYTDNPTEAINTNCTITGC
jgi:hypothetical protein